MSCGTRRRYFQDRRPLVIHAPISLRLPVDHRMKLITRRDAGLATSLIVAIFVLFNRPLEGLFELADSVERTYDLALVPALTVLAVTLAFHQYQRRREIAEQARQALARNQEVERLLRLGRALAESLDAESIRQTLYRLLPTFCGERRCWMLRFQDQQWLEFLGDDTATPIEAMETAPARLTQADPADVPLENTGLLIGDDVCFALVAGGKTVGVLGVSNRPSLSDTERGAIAAMAALVALALRNLEVLDDSRRRAIRDELTGCATRGYGLERLQVELRQSVSHRTAGVDSAVRHRRLQGRQRHRRASDRRPGAAERGGHRQATASHQRPVLPDRRGRIPGRAARDSGRRAR